MKEIETVDFDRIHSATASADGERIVLTFTSKAGHINLSLPVTQITGLITAICGAGQMAKGASTGGTRKPVVIIEANRLDLKMHKTRDEALLAVGIAPQTELVFRTSRQNLIQVVDDWAQALGLKPPSAGKSLQ